ncbi:MAG: hypothetical protein HY747_03775 [Elusimicrobia bacterium]|nr:hypothetical protein [Elusimicrobiota bacterium]
MKRAGFAAMIFLIGACAPAARQKAMKFFFDETPASDAGAEAPLGQAPGQEETAAPSPVPQSGGGAPKSRHPPYEDRSSCGACHDADSGAAAASGRNSVPEAMRSGAAGLRTKPPALCFECHDRFDKKGRKVHWPLKQGRCVFCHDPHESANEKLLKMPAAALCLACHDAEQTPHGADAGVCVECHDPHSSIQPKLMK